MHDYAFSARWRGANPEALETRMTTLADTIAAALTADVDEVLIVGHSSGVHLAVSILADFMRSMRLGSRLSPGSQPSPMVRRKKLRSRRATLPLIS